MRFIITAYKPVRTYATGTRPALCPDGAETYHAPVLAIGPLCLNAGTDSTDPAIVSHLAYLTAQDVGCHLLETAAGARAVDLPATVPTADEVAQALRVNRIGDPASDTIFIFTPADVSKAIAYTKGTIYNAQKCDISAKLAGKMDADPAEVEKAKQAWLACVEKALKDPAVMQWQFIPCPPGKAIDAFNRADYVKQAKQAIYGGNVCA